MFGVERICQQSILARIANLAESFAKNRSGLKGGAPVAYHYLTRATLKLQRCWYTGAKTKILSRHIHTDIETEIVVSSRYHDRTLHEFAPQGGEREGGDDIRCAAEKKLRFQFLFLRSTSERVVLDYSIYPDWWILTFDFSGDRVSIGRYTSPYASNTSRRMIFHGMTYLTS